LASIDILGLPIVLKDEAQLLSGRGVVVHGGAQCPLGVLVALREKVLIIHF
jgi:hypothetical protein